MVDYRLIIERDCGPGGRQVGRNADAHQLGQITRILRLLQPISSARDDVCGSWTLAMQWKGPHVHAIPALEPFGVP